MNNFIQNYVDVTYAKCIIIINYVLCILINYLQNTDFN